MNEVMHIIKNLLKSFLVSFSSGYYVIEMAELNSAHIT